MRFLMIPELRNAVRWRYNGIIDHPFYKNGPLYSWVSDKGHCVMVNRQLFRAMMTNRLDKP